MNSTALTFAAAFLLAALSALVLLKESRQGRVPLASGLFLLAVVELFDALAVQDVGRFFSYKRLVLVCISLVPPTFLLYGLGDIRKSAGGSRGLAMLPLLAVSLLFCSAAVALPMEELYAGIDVEEGLLLVLGRIGYWFYIGLMIFFIAALVNLESGFAGTRGADRWHVKYEFLGVATILAMMIFYFSQGLLYRAVNMGLLPVRSAVLIVSVLLVGYSRLYRGRTANLAVSRQALYRSFTLVAVGLYLLVLGLLGEGMKRFNISVSRDLSVFVAILSGVAFLVLLWSEEIRRRIKVLIAKHFYARKHDYREEWLGFSNALAGCRDSDGVRAAIVDRYRQLFGLRSAVLYTREAGADSFALAARQERPGTPARVRLSSGLLGYFSETGRVMNPADGEYTPTADESAFIREAGAWLLVPLLAGDRLEAFVVFGAQLAPEKLTYEDFDLMKVLGRQAVLSLRNYQLAEELADAREMAAVAKVSSFVIHDLKNLAYTFSLMMENAGEHIAEPEFQRDLVRSIQGTVGKMNALIGKLKALPEKTELKREPVDLARLSREVLVEVQVLRKAISFEADYAGAEASGDAQEIRKVVLNLLLNACDAVGEKGNVRLKTGRRDGEVLASVEDNGHGMSEAFMQGQLFRPFRTTKEKGLGIGLYQCKQIAEALGGRIEVQSREGKGTVFTLVLPESGQ